MATSKRHPHKYHKIQLSFGKVWACALPECSHYMPLHMTELVVGKFSICWKCGEQFVLEPHHLKLDKPICNDCNPFEIKSITEFLEEKGIINE